MDQFDTGVTMLARGEISRLRLRFDLTLFENELNVKIQHIVRAGRSRAKGGTRAVRFSFPTTKIDPSRVHQVLDLFEFGRFSR